MVKTAAKVTCLTYAEYHCGAILDTSEWRVVDVCAGLLLAASTKNKYVYISLLNFSILLYLIIGVKIGFFSALVGSFFLAALKRLIISLFFICTRLLYYLESHSGVLSTGMS